MNNDEGIAATLGLVVMWYGGEVRIPVDFVSKGFEREQRVAVSRDDDTDELVVRLEDV